MVLGRPHLVFLLYFLLPPCSPHPVGDTFCLSPYFDAHSGHYHLVLRLEGLMDFTASNDYLGSVVAYTGYPRDTSNRQIYTLVDIEDGNRTKTAHVDSNFTLQRVHLNTG